MTFRTFLAIAASLGAAGCKLTSARHTWPDGAVTAVFDGRIFHKQEAAFVLERSTNGATSVRALVNSGVDEQAVRTAFDAGLQVGKKVAGVP